MGTGEEGMLLAAAVEGDGDSDYEYDEEEREERARELRKQQQESLERERKEEEEMEREEREKREKEERERERRLKAAGEIGGVLRREEVGRGVGESIWPLLIPSHPIPSHSIPSRAISSHLVPSLAVPSLTIPSRARAPRGRLRGRRRVRTHGDTARHRARSAGRNGDQRKTQARRRIVLALALAHAGRRRRCDRGIEQQRRHGRQGWRRRLVLGIIAEVAAAPGQATEKGG